MMRGKVSLSRLMSKSSDGDDGAVNGAVAVWQCAVTPCSTLQAFVLLNTNVLTIANQYPRLVR